MRTYPLTQSEATLSVIFLAGVFLSLVQGCGRKEGLLSSEDREELLGLLQRAGIHATFMSDCFLLPQSGSHQRGSQGFILRVDHVAGRVELTSSGLAQAIGPIIEEYVTDNNLRYEHVNIQIGQGTQATSFRVWLRSTPSSAEPTTAVSKKRFRGVHVAFDYPEQWRDWDEASFGRVKTLLESQGIELQVLLKLADDASAFSIARSPNPSSFEQFYQGKKEMVDRVTDNGVEIMGERYGKYSVKRTLDLGDDAKALLSQAEKPSGETVISYYLLRDNYEYSINFIYPSKDALDGSRGVRRELLRSLVVLENKGEHQNYTHFSQWGLSFDYPRGWQEHRADRVAMMKEYLARELSPYGRTLQEFAMIVGPNDETALLVSKSATPRAMKPSEFIEERNQVYEDAKRAGDVTKVNHVKESTIANLPAVEEDVERSNGGRGRTYKVIDGTTVFEISFIAGNASEFSNYSVVLDHLVSSMKVAGITERPQNIGGQK